MRAIPKLFFHQNECAEGCALTQGKEQSDEDPPAGGKVVIQKTQLVFHLNNQTGCGHCSANASLLSEHTFLNCNISIGKSLLLSVSGSNAGRLTGCLGEKSERSCLHRTEVPQEPQILYCERKEGWQEGKEL